MWIGNVMLVILNLPMIGVWIRLLTARYCPPFPGIVLFCALGVYSTNNSTWDIWMVGIFGVLGYVFAKLKREPAPLMLGSFGPMMEENLRRALLLARGEWTVFLSSPISAGLLLCACRLSAGTVVVGDSPKTGIARSKLSRPCALAGAAYGTSTSAAHGCPASTHWKRTCEPPQTVQAARNTRGVSLPSGRPR